MLLGTKQGSLLSSLLLNIVLDVASSIVRQTKSVEGVETGKKKSVFSLT
jgi:hypothetical protein